MADEKKAKTCFVIAPIGEEGSDTRKRSDLVFRHVFKIAAQNCGYEIIVRADEISKPGIITTQVIEHLLKDDLVIADLSGHNPNVFYELAIRHMVRKPVLQVGKTGEQLPFDVAQSRAIKLDHTDLDSALACRLELIKQIKAIETSPNDIDNPISIALDTRALTTTGNPGDQVIPQILRLLEDISSRLRSIEMKAESETARNSLVSKLERQIASEVIEKPELLNSYSLDALRKLFLDAGKE